MSRNRQLAEIAIAASLGAAGTFGGPTGAAAAAGAQTLLSQMFSRVDKQQRQIQQQYSALLDEVTDDLQAFLKHEASGSDALISQCGELLREHGLTTSELLACRNAGKKPAALVCMRGESLLVGLDHDEKALLRRLLGLIYERLNTRLEQLDGVLGALIDEVGRVHREHCARLDAQDTERREARERLCRTLLRQPARDLPNPDDPQPTHLLQARHQVVKLLGRERLRAELFDWCEDDRRIAVRSYAAPGGAGKTRLMIELTAAMRRAGWQAGFLKSSKWSVCDIAELAAIGEPLLLVLDYADGRINDTAELLNEVIELQANPDVRLRLVLLARPGTGWWDEVKQRCRDWAELNCPTQPLLLPDALADEQSRRLLYQQALQDFAQRLAQPTPQIRDDAIPDRQASALELLMAALLNVYGTSGTDRESLCRQILGREQDYLRCALGESDTKGITRAAWQALALHTIVGGVADEAESRELTRRAPLLDGHGASDIDKVRTTLHDLYPHGDGIGALTPDLLGEYLGWKTLDDRQDDNHVLIDRLINDAHPDWLLNYTEWLRRLYAWPNENNVRTWCEASADFAHDLAVLRLNHSTAYKLESTTRLAYNSELFSLLHLWIAAQAVEHASKYRNPLDAERALDLATKLDSLATRLIGYNNEVAITAAKSSSDIYRQLTEKCSTQFLPDYAVTKSNLAACFSASGYHIEALEQTKHAVDIYRKLEQSEFDAHAAAFAGVLNNFSADLLQFERTEQALAAAKEATEIYRNLHRINPESFSSHLAQSLLCLSNCQDESQHPIDAFSSAGEALEIYRKLESENPDLYQSGLAKCLVNYANRLCDLGLPGIALHSSNEAVELLENISQRRESIQPDFALSLANNAAILFELGSIKEALTTTLRAVEIQRTVSERDADPCPDYLGMSLLNLAAHFNQLGSYHDAITAVSEAHAIFENLTQSYPKRFSNHLKSSADLKAQILHEINLSSESEK